MNLLARIKKNIKNNLIPGVVVVVPLVIALIVLKWLIDFFDGLIEPLINNYVHLYIPGLGLLVSLVFIYLVGLSTKNYFTNKLLQTGEKFVVRIPVAKTVYAAVKQVLETITSREGRQAQRVVMIEYPSKGIFSLGLYNGEIASPDGKTLLGSVLIITSINPASGFTVLVPCTEIRFVDVSVEQMMKFVVSGGIVMPDQLKIVDDSQERVSEEN